MLLYCSAAIRAGLFVDEKHFRGPFPEGTEEKAYARPLKELLGIVNRSGICDHIGSIRRQGERIGRF